MGQTAARKPAKQTAESRLLDATLTRLVEGGRKLTDIAQRSGCSPAELYQWRAAIRTVPANKAQILASEIGLEPGAISAPFRKGRDLHGGETPNKAPAEVRLRVLQNDVIAIRYVLGPLFAVMLKHRPAEAKDLVAALRKTPAEFQARNGLVHQLLAALDPPHAD